MGMSEFLQVELEAGQARVVDASGDRESMQKNPIKNYQEAQSRSIVDLNPLRLARVRKGHAEILKLKFFQREFNIRGGARTISCQL